MPRGIYPRKSLESRFWAKVIKTDFCWLWIGAKAGNGYGNFFLNGRNKQAHIVSFEWITGSIPEGLELDHLCRNPLCVNPEHLEAVSHNVNLLRGIGFIARQSVVTHCPNNHAYNLLSTYYRPDGKGRECLICRRTRALNSYYNKINTKPQATIAADLVLL